MTNNNQNPQQPNKQQLNFTPEQKIILVSLALVAGMVVILFVTVLQLYQPQQPQPQQVGPVGAPSEPTATPRQLTVSDMPTADLPPTDTPVPTNTTMWTSAISATTEAYMTRVPAISATIATILTDEAKGIWTPRPTMTLPPNVEIIGTGHWRALPSNQTPTPDLIICERFFRSTGQTLEGCEELVKP